VRVFVVEESAALSVRLLERLREVPELDVIGTARTVTGAMRAITTLVPDVVIADTEMAEGKGFALLHVIKAWRAVERDGPRVLVWTGCQDPRRQATAFALGAEAHFDKAREVDLLVDYCRQAAAACRG
jgi:DNA-binding NarL/FixJ family response regulator